MDHPDADDGSARFLRFSPPCVNVKYKSQETLLRTMDKNPKAEFKIDVDDVITMVSEFANVSRGELLRAATVAWFYYALGYPVLEADCHEQDQTDDMPYRLLVFRVKLDADYDAELADASNDRAKLTDKYRSLLTSVLPEEIRKESEASDLDKVVKISWTKEGSVELGGFTAIGPAALVIVSMALGTIRPPIHGRMTWDSCCCCMTRPGRAEYFSLCEALPAFRERSAKVNIAIDGSATFDMGHLSLTGICYRMKTRKCLSCDIL